MKQAAAPKSRNRTVQAILRLLKKDGPRDAVGLAARLRISDAGVRQHLYVLREQGLVNYREEARPMGRPAKLWHLTSAANRLFPNAHAALTLSLLSATNKVFGKKGLNQVVKERARQQSEKYRALMPARATLEKKLQALASLRNKEGYMAAAQKQRDGSYLLIENHCAIWGAAHDCRQLCQGELDVFRSILGAGVSVEPEQRMSEGARRCVYRVRAEKG